MDSVSKGRNISSLVVSHVQRNMNQNNNTEALWRMRRSNFEGVRGIGKSLTRPFESFSDIEHLRVKLANQQAIDSKKASWAAFIGRLIQGISPSSILEIGTCIGISSAYISRYNPEAKIDTIEYESDLVIEAKKNLASMNIHNVWVFEGDYHTVMPMLVNKNKYDVIFKDAYHKGLANIALIDYLRSVGYVGFVILDDIRWSWDMLSAWNRIKTMEYVKVVIDAYHIGIVYLDDKSIHPKEHYKYSLSGLLPS